jgi:hypothetical protein
MEVAAELGIPLEIVQRKVNLGNPRVCVCFIAVSLGGVYVCVCVQWQRFCALTQGVPLGFCRGQSLPIPLPPGRRERAAVQLERGP